MSHFSLALPMEHIHRELHSLIGASPFSYKVNYTLTSCARLAGRCLMNILSGVPESSSMSTATNVVR